MHHRRRRSSLINILTESVAENDVKDIPGPVLQQLRRRYAEAVADPDGRATYAEFAKLVGAAAPSVGFVEDEWEDRTDEQNTIGFDDFRVVMKKIEVRRTVVIVATATVVAVFFNYMKVSTQLVAIFMPSDVIDSSIYLSTDWDVPAYTPEHIATMVFAAITLLIFTVGAPIAALGVLIYMHKKDRLAEPEIFTMFGFLYAGYKPKYFWWESVVLLRKVAATVIALSPIGLELQAISATVLLGVFTAIQLVVRPFRNERHNVLDCSAMSSIALKQLCALAYHYVSMNTIDTLASQQRFTFVSWVVILVVMSTSIALIFFFMGQFTVFKIEEKNADRLMAVAAEQKAWRMDEEMELSTNEKVIAFAKRVLCAAWAYVKGKLRRGGGAQGGEVEHGEDMGDTVVQVRGERDEVKEALVAFTTESVVKHERELCEIIEEIKGHAEDGKAAKARMAAMIAKHNEIIALRLIEGEEIDGDGTVVLAREPLTVFGAAEAKLCPRCCRNKRTSRLHIPTGVVTRGAAQEVVAPNAAAAASVAAAPLQQREQVVTINPVGIALQALSRAVRTSDGSGGDAAAARSSGGAAGEGGGGGGGGAAAHCGGERSDIMHLNRMAVGHLSADEGGRGAGIENGAASLPEEEEEEVPQTAPWI
jgi:hypothetical protein